MSRIQTYSGALTAEQFLFYEIRIASRFYLDGASLDDAAAKIQEQNLFQYPTEREVKRMTRACYKRLDALENHELIKELSSAPAEIAKQINLYAMMRYNLLVWDFMVQLIGEKYKSQDMSLTPKDMNGFFARMQAQSDQIAGWSDKTIKKIRGVLLRALTETGYIDTVRSTVLNPVFISQELEDGIRENGDSQALAAFNCFR